MKKIILIITTMLTTPVFANSLTDYAKLSPTQQNNIDEGRSANDNGVTQRVVYYIKGVRHVRFVQVPNSSLTIQNGTVTRPGGLQKPNVGCIGGCR